MTQPRLSDPAEVVKRYQALAQEAQAIQDLIGQLQQARDEFHRLAAAVADALKNLERSKQQAEQAQRQIQTLESKGNELLFRFDKSLSTLGVVLTMFEQTITDRADRALAQLASRLTAQTEGLRGELTRFGTEVSELARQVAGLQQEWMGRLDQAQQHLQALVDREVQERRHALHGLEIKTDTKLKAVSDETARHVRHMQAQLKRLQGTGIAVAAVLLLLSLVGLVR